MTKNVLTIAGSDILSSGGMQADLATFAAYKLYPFVALTSIVTIQDDSYTINPTSSHLLKEQLDSLKNIDFAGIKVGLLPDQESLMIVVDFLKDINTKIVVDPVLVFKENNDEQVSSMKKFFIEEIFPLADFITPNLLEAEILAGQKITSMEQMKEVARLLYSFGPANVVIKGGNRFDSEKAQDLLYDGRNFKVFEKDILDKNNNGAGCTFAAAITANLAKGEKATKSVQIAKSFVYEAIKNSNQYGVVQNYEN